MHRHPTTSTATTVSSGVSHRGQTFAGLVRHRHARLNTYWYASRKGTLPEGATVLLPLLHGIGPTTSHAGSMLAVLNALTGSKKKPGRSKSLAALRDLPYHREVGAATIDLPGCAGTPAPHALRSLPNYAQWLASWFQELQADHGVPLIPIARSASATPLAEICKQHPGLIEGVVLLSPMLPRDATHSNADLLRRVEAGECELNRQGFDLMNTLNAQTDWDRTADPFAGTPTLILTGSRDTQVSDRVRAQCAEWDASNALVEHVDIEGAPHDVFNLRERPSGVRAFGSLYCFLHKRVPV
ncbi:MAG: hypothetical protein AAGF84_01740 [Planctomycetota bacterium]